MVSKILDGEIVIASHNKGKIIEFSDLFKDYNLNLSSSSDYNIEEPEENGSSFAENALIKAKATMLGSKKISISDDSGLCVDCLNGEPGIYSARWAGRNKDFSVAMRNILVKDIMRYDFTSVNKDESLSIVRDKLRQKKLGDIFVTDDENLLLGDICVYSMADKAFNTDDDINSRAIDVADLNTIRVNLIDNLEQILPIYRENSKSVVAVVDDKGKLVGILNQNDVLIAYKNIIIDTRRSERL